jgi:hypothetical protein
MLYRFAVFLLLANIAIATTTTRFAPAAEPQGGQFGSPRVVVPAPEDPRYAHLAWPKLVKTRDGTLVAAYSAGRFHGNGGEGCPAVSVSRDKGRTFTRPKILRRFDRDDRYDNSANTALGLADDGAVVLLAMAYTGNQRNSIFGWRSADSGCTWQGVDTSSLAEGRTGSVYGHIFPVPGKGLAVTGHFRPGSKKRTEGIWIAYSRDQGRSWGPPQVITERKLFEPAVVFTQGRFVGLFRQSGPAPFYWLAVSDERGAAWKLSRWPERPTRDRTLPSPFLAVAPGEADRLYALESQRHVKGNLPGRIVLWTADAGRLDWRRRGVVVEFPETLAPRNDITYPWMVPLEGNDWFLVFYCGRPRGPSAIYGMRLTIPAAG